MGCDLLVGLHCWASTGGEVRRDVVIFEISSDRLP